jgi:hypothetical protein
MHEAGMGEQQHDKLSEVARRVREDMHAATDRLRARLDELRLMRDEPEPPPRNARNPGSAPSR